MFSSYPKRHILIMKAPPPPLMYCQLSLLRVVPAPQLMPDRCLRGFRVCQLQDRMFLKFRDLGLRLLGGLEFRV